MIPARESSKRYLDSVSMQAAVSTMKLASNVLGFEVLELWCWDDNNKDYRCTYAYVDDKTLEQYPSLCHGYLPDKSETSEISKALCLQAVASPHKMVWEVVKRESDGSVPVVRMNKGNTSTAIERWYSEAGMPVRTKVCCCLDIGSSEDEFSSSRSSSSSGTTSAVGSSVVATTQIILVGVSTQEVKHTKARKAFLDTLGRAIFIAAFYLDNEEALEKEEGAAGAAHSTVGPLSNNNMHNNMVTSDSSPNKLQQFNSCNGDPDPEITLVPDNGKNERGRKTASARYREKMWDIRAAHNNPRSPIFASLDNLSAFDENLSSQRSDEGEYGGGGGGPTSPASDKCDNPQQHRRNRHSIGSVSSVSDFSYLAPIVNLPILRQVPEHMDMAHFDNIEFVIHGSHANIYEAYYRGERVIIKMIKPTSELSESAIAEFEMEAAILPRMQHPNIIRVLGSGFLPRRFIVLEYLAGGILEDHLEENELKTGLAARLFKKPTFSYVGLLTAGKQLADAMHYLHSMCSPTTTIIHRDIKPDNVGFTEDGTLKLFDFGLVKCVKGRTYENQAYAMTGHTGTLRYMAPEVVLSEPYNEKVDVYSFSLLLWRMASDKRPYKSLGTYELFVDNVVNGEERPKLYKNWPQQFCTLLENCWSGVPEQRPAFGIVSTVLNEECNRAMDENVKLSSSIFTRYNNSNKTISNSTGSSAMRVAAVKHNADLAGSYATADAETFPPAPPAGPAAVGMAATNGLGLGVAGSSTTAGVGEGRGRAEEAGGVPGAITVDRSSSSSSITNNTSRLVPASKLGGSKPNAPKSFLSKSTAAAATAAASGLMSGTGRDVTNAVSSPPLLSSSSSASSSSNSDTAKKAPTNGMIDI